MSDVPTDHIVHRLTEAIMAAVKPKKGDAELRRRIAALLHVEAAQLVRIGLDEATNAIAARRREV